ncbi:MAG: SHOCT domain-containing protein [Solirubrobacteraceae bacterium]
MRRRPLLRAAAVGGGAYYMGKRHAEGQAREDEQDARISDVESQPAAAPATPPAPAGGMSQDAINQLQQLGQLHEQGVLTDEEFAQQKAKLLG